jgi:hypothetical protein
MTGGGERTKAAIAFEVVDNKGKAKAVQYGYLLSLKGP